MALSTRKKLLIFGSGFLSRFIAKAAQAEGVEPIVLYQKHLPEDLGDVTQVRYTSCDLTSFLKELRPSYIIALQGSSFVPDNNCLVESLNANLMLTLQFMEEVMVLTQQGMMSPEKIIFVGSAAEYGRRYLEPISEIFPLHPTSIYGLTKIFLFNAAMYYCEKGLPVVYTRQFNCTGPYQRPDFVVPSLCRQIAMIEKGLKEGVSIGDVSQKRDFIDVRDAARAYMFLFAQGRVGEVYNVGSGHAVSVANVLEKAIFLARSFAAITTTVNRQLFFNETAISDTICADVSKLGLLGFKPSFSLDDTILDVIDFWRKRV